MIRYKNYISRAFTLYIPLALFLVFLLFPFFWMILTSIKSTPELYNPDISPFLVKDFTISHYIELFQKFPFTTWLGNTYKVTLAATFISLIFGIMAGYALARLQFRGSTVIGIAIIGTYLLPPILLFLPLTKVTTYLGVYDTLWALIVTYPTMLVPFITWTLVGYLTTLPKEVEEMGLIDGCSRIGVITRIVVPMAIPGILSAFIFSFLQSWREYLYALTLINTQARKTLPVGVVGALIQGDVFNWGVMMAATVVGTIPLLIFYSFLTKYFVAGLTGGAVKG